MNTKLIISLVSLAICVGCYVDIRRKRIALEKDLKQMKAVRPLYVQPKLFGMSPQWMILVSVVVLTAILLVQL
jgi:low affinity Fe/Cu permease